MKRLSEEQFQLVAHHFAENMLVNLDRAHELVYGAHVSGDGSPFVQGAIAGLLQYMVDGGHTDADVYDFIQRTVERTLPQIRFAIAHGQDGGRA